MNEHILNYWIEAVESALDDVGKIALFSKEDIKTLAETLQISSEQKSMAFGYEHIPNPLESEIQKIKSQYENKIAKLEQNEWVYRKNIANRHRINPENVYLDGENILYDLR